MRLKLLLSLLVFVVNISNVFVNCLIQCQKLPQDLRAIMVYYKLGQIVISNQGSYFITNWGKFITNWGRYYKLGQFITN